MLEESCQFVRGRYTEDSSRVYLDVVLSRNVESWTAAVLGLLQEQSELTDGVMNGRDGCGDINNLVEKGN